MSEDKHSPLPWQDDKDGDIVCPSEDYDLIATIYAPTDISVEIKDNAAFVVKACNAYYELTAQNKMLASAAGEMARYIEREHKGEGYIDTPLVISKHAPAITLAKEILGENG